ncbi:MAG: helix-turn-helix domain-containing protein, partial [Bacteroidetes bacterium]|nr:helix-turn-helix domain-containing protein [Bacteroidota bacterium]
MPVSAENLRFILGLKLKNLRTDQDLSLKDVSERAGLSISYLSEIEKGKKYPKPDKLLDLSRALDIPFDDLVSLKLDQDLNPIKEVFDSTFVREFPFELFGLTPRDLFDLTRDDPGKAGALFQTFLDVGRMYDVQVEHFLFAALRSYQQMHANYFDDLEAAAAAFRHAHGWNGDAPIGEEELRAMLEQDYGYDIDTATLHDHPHLSGLRSVYDAEGRPRLYVNAQLLPEQRAFVYGREIGFQHLGLDERPRTSSWIQATSFDEVLNNFRASYFSGAMLIPQDRLCDDLDRFFAKEQ